MEQMDELRRPEDKTRLMYKVVCWFSGIIIFVTVSYGVSSSVVYASGSIPVIGQSLVNVSFPLPYFARPVTYLTLACITFFYSGLRLWQYKVAQWSQVKLASLQLVAIVVAFSSAYQVAYSFMLWGSYFSLELLYNNLANPVSLSSPGPAPWNLVFATQIFAALFVVSSYSVYFLRKVHQVRGISDEI